MDTPIAEDASFVLGLGRYASTLSATAFKTFRASVMDQLFGLIEKSSRRWSKYERPRSLMWPSTIFIAVV